MLAAKPELPRFGLLKKPSILSTFYDPLSFLKPLRQPPGEDLKSIVAKIRSFSSSPPNLHKPSEQEFRRAVSFIKHGSPGSQPFYFEPEDPFGGKKVFSSYEAAVLQASMHIRKKMKAENGVREYAYGVECNADATKCALGDLITGDNLQTDLSSLSDRQNMRFKPFGHSHPGISYENQSIYSAAGLYIRWSEENFKKAQFRTGILSRDDFVRMSISDPIAGSTRHTLFNYDPSKAIIVSMDQSLFPPFRTKIGRIYENDDPAIMREFIETNKANGKIKINNYIIDDEGAYLCNEKCANEGDKYFSESYTSSPLTSSDEYF